MWYAVIDIFARRPAFTFQVFHISAKSQRSSWLCAWCNNITHWTVFITWSHNGRDGVSNHQPYDCLLSGLFRRRSAKTPKLRVTGLCAGIHRLPANSPHKGPITRKLFHLMTSSCCTYIRCNLRIYENQRQPSRHWQLSSECNATEYR